MPTENSNPKIPQDDDARPDEDKSNGFQQGDSSDPLNDDFLSEVRKGLEDSRPKNAPFTQTGQLGEFFKRVTGRLNPANLPSSDSLEAPPKADSVQILSEKPSNAGTRPLYPFDRNIPFPGNAPSVTPENPEKQSGESSELPPTVEFFPKPPSIPGQGSPGVTGLLGTKKPTPTNTLSKLSQNLQGKTTSSLGSKINSPERKSLLGSFEQGVQFGNQNDYHDPFVDEVAPIPQGASTSLVSKIRNGSVPADTLRLLITASASEAEVLAICSELNIDWESVSGETREEKTQNLIEYFNNHENYLDFKEVAVSLSRQLSTQEEDWSESEARLKELQKNLTSEETESRWEPEVVEQEEKKLTFWDHLREDFLNASPLQRALVVGLSIIVLGLLAVVTVFMVFPQRASQIASPQYTPVPSDLPIPKALELPGGWIFNLQLGVLQEGAWQPKGAEWLMNTDICRLVSLPWNRQLEAVYGTFQPGDELLLTMSNADLLRYRIKDLKTLSLIDFNSDDMNQIVGGNSPCLVVILTRDQVETRQLLIAEPSGFAAWETVVTVTPALPISQPEPVQPTATAIPTKNP